jgi:hypothetical protein
VCAGREQGPASFSERNDQSLSHPLIAVTRLYHLASEFGTSEMNLSVLLVSFAATLMAVWMYVVVNYA